MKLLHVLFNKQFKIKQLTLICRSPSRIPLTLLRLDGGETHPAKQPEESLSCLSAQDLVISPVVPLNILARDCCHVKALSLN